MFTDKGKLVIPQYRSGAAFYHFTFGNYIVLLQTTTKQNT